MKKIIYLFCLIFTGHQCRIFLPDRRYGENPEKRYRGKRIGQIPN